MSAMCGTSASKKRRRKRLFERQSGLCYWCKVPMLMEPDGTIPRVSRLSATFDHLHPRGHPERLAEQARGICRIVLACYRCNQRRDQAFQGKQPGRRPIARSPKDAPPAVAPGDLVPTAAHEPASPARPRMLYEDYERQKRANEFEPWSPYSPPAGSLEP